MTSNKYIVLGGDMVPGHAAKELAGRGPGPVELLIISADDALPYEGPPLSKGFLSGKESESRILIKNPKWYRRQGIDVKLQTVIEILDLQKKQLRATSGETLEFGL